MVTGILDDVGASLLPPHRAHILPIICGLLAPGKKVNGCDGKLYSGVQCTVYSVLSCVHVIRHGPPPPHILLLLSSADTVSAATAVVMGTHHQYQHHAQLSDNL